MEKSRLKECPELKNPVNEFTVKFMNRFERETRTKLILPPFALPSLYRKVRHEGYR